MKRRVALQLLGQAQPGMLPPTPWQGSHHIYHARYLQVHHPRQASRGLLPSWVACPLLSDGCRFSSLVCLASRLAAELAAAACPPAPVPPPQVSFSNGQQTMGVSMPWAISAALDARDPGRSAWG